MYNITPHITNISCVSKTKGIQGFNARGMKYIIRSIFSKPASWFQLPTQYIWLIWSSTAIESFFLFFDRFEMTTKIEQIASARKFQNFLTSWFSIELIDFMFDWSTRKIYLNNTFLLGPIRCLAKTLKVDGIFDLLSFDIYV